MTFSTRTCAWTAAALATMLVAQAAAQPKLPAGASIRRKLGVPLVDGKAPRPTDDLVRRKFEPDNKAREEKAKEEEAKEEPKPAAKIEPPPAAPSAPSSLGTTASADGSLPGEKAATECIKLNPHKKYKWDQRGEIDLASLLAWAQSAFCIPLIVPSNLRQQKVTIYAPGTMTPAEMYRMFLSSLNAMGLTVQPQGPRARPTALVVIESNRARETAIPTLGADDAIPHDDGFVTKVVRLEHLSTEEVLPILNRLKSQPGDVVPAPPSTLIITDVAENIRRMESVINLLDLPMGGEKIWLIKLNTVGATEMATMLKEIFLPKTGAGSKKINLIEGRGQPASASAEAGGGGDMSVSQIIAEERSNTLIVVSTERAYQRILGLVRSLDQASASLDAPTDRVHVYFLANANAEDMANTLSSLGVSVSGGRKGGAKAGGDRAAGQAASLFEGEVKIAADKPTNSLIIVAAGRDYVLLRDLIRKLDISRRQVFLEATILEVSLDKSRKLGLGFHAGSTVFSGENQSLAFGGMEPNSSANSILFSPAALSGLAAGLRGPAIPGAEKILGLAPGQSIPAFGVFVQALQNNNDVNVVSMPHVLTSDNEKALIQVGRNLPFPGSIGNMANMAGAAAGQAGAAMLGFGTSVQRQDVALKLEITPHVNDSDFIRLEVDNEISDVASENFNGLGPATDKRHVKTTVVVRDQQSVVLGGLIKDRIAESVDKVPLLGDIPILGYLFKYTRKTVLKQNLLIILTPYIIKDPSDLRRIFERKIAERKEFLERYSAFQDERNYDPEVDYRRKRGLLEEINRVGKEAEQDAAELQAAEASMHGRIVDGAVEPATQIDYRKPSSPSKGKPDAARPDAGKSDASKPDGKAARPKEDGGKRP